MSGLLLSLALLGLAQPARSVHSVRQPAARSSLPPICIPVEIGHDGPFLFGFDTGISPSTVTPELVKRLKLPVLGKVQVTDASNTGHHSALAVRIDSLTAFGRDFTPHLAVVVPARDNGCAKDSLGTLGLRLFRDFLLRVDLQAGSLEISDPVKARLTDADPHTLPYRLERSMPMVKIAVGPTVLRAGIDTGGEFGIILPTSIAEKLPLGPVFATGRMRTVVGEFPFKQAQLLGTLVLGGNDVPAPVISFSDYFPITIMGRLLLARFLLTFDQKSHLVRIAPRRASP